VTQSREPAKARDSDRARDAGVGRGEHHPGIRMDPHDDHRLEHDEVLRVVTATSPGEVSDAAGICALQTWSHWPAVEVANGGVGAA
jgi:hypothetical protein